MNANALRPRSSIENPISPELAAVIAYGLVVLVFLGDWFTPAAVVVALAYEAPVLFSALKGTQRLTKLTIVLASFGIGLGWLVDLANASFVFSETRLANRAFTLLSLWIVGWLVLLLQRNVARTEALGLERSLQRESAFSRVVSALSPGTTVQALIAEAPQLLEAPVAVWYSTAPAPLAGSWVTVHGDSNATALDVAPSASFDALIARLRAKNAVEVVSAAETIGYLTGRQYGSKNALAIPVGNGSQTVGIVFAAVQSARVEERSLVEAGNFAKFATTAMQAHRANQELVRAGA
jgi:hypothetical protein